MMVRFAVALAVCLICAGAAQAETSAVPLTATSDVNADLFSVARTPKGAGYAQTAALQEAGIVQTSVDQHLAGKSSVVGSLGFLCGLQPAYAHAGAADARGYDPQGKFVGAKLSFAFK